MAMNNPSAGAANPHRRSLTNKSNGLAVIVLDEFGPGLDRSRFNDVACLLFEDVPGFELMTPRQLMASTHTMWVWYCMVMKSDHTH